MTIKNPPLTLNIFIFIFTFTHYGVRSDGSPPSGLSSPIKNAYGELFSSHRNDDETRNNFETISSSSPLSKTSITIGKEQSGKLTTPQLDVLESASDLDEGDPEEIFQDASASVSGSFSLRDMLEGPLPLRDMLEEELGDESEEFVVLMKGNPAADRVTIEDDCSSVFLSNKKLNPTINFENMVYRIEIREPPEDDEMMNAARMKCRETPETMEYAKKELILLLRNNTEMIVPWENSAWLIRFLRARRYNVPKTYELIKNYYKFRFKNRFMYDNLLPSKMRHVLEKGILGLLPHSDQFRKRVAVAFAEKWDPEENPILEMLRMIVILVEIALYEPSIQLGGFQGIADLKNMTWSQVWHVDLKLIPKMIHWIMNCLPLDFEAIHVVNQPKWFWMAYKIFKPFLPKEYVKKIHVHGTDWEELHKFIPASVLPDIYGGTYPMISLSTYEWDVFLRFLDKEYKGIDLPPIGMRMRMLF